MRVLPRLFLPALALILVLSGSNSFAEEKPPKLKLEHYYKVPVRVTFHRFYGKDVKLIINGEVFLKEHLDVADRSTEISTSMRAELDRKCDFILMFDDRKIEISMNISAEKPFIIISPDAPFIRAFSYLGLD